MGPSSVPSTSSPNGAPPNPPVVRCLAGHRVVGNDSSTPALSSIQEEKGDGARRLAFVGLMMGQILSRAWIRPRDAELPQDLGDMQSWRGQVSIGLSRRHP